MEGGKHEEHSLGILYQEYKLRKLSEVEKKKKKQHSRKCADSFCP